MVLYVRGIVLEASTGWSYAPTARPSNQARIKTESSTKGRGRRGSGEGVYCMLTVRDVFDGRGSVYHRLVGGRKRKDAVCIGHPGAKGNKAR